MMYFLKWYGSYNYKISNSFKNKKSKFKSKLKNTAFLINNTINLNIYKLNFYLPSDWCFLLIKKTNNNLIYFYLYSLNYFFILPLFKKFLFFKYDSQVNSLIFHFYFKNNFYSLFWNHFKILFYSFSKIFFKKLKFKGKGFYIYKNNRNTIALQFGYSHLLYLYSFFITVKFLTKTTILMFGINNNDLSFGSYALYNIKKINIFTGKGIRFARQIVYRKTGKVSSYR